MERHRRHRARHRRHPHRPHDHDHVVGLGDTGQHDPEIYRSIIESDRAEDVRRLFDDATVPLALAGDALGLAEVAESTGLTPRGWTERVAQSTAP